MKKEKILYIAIIVAALASTLYLLMLGYYALPVADDLGWARQATDNGSFGFMKMFYYGWQGRYSAILVDGTLCRCLGWNEHLLGFAIVELLLGYGAVYLLLRDSLQSKDSGLMLLISIIVTNLGVMAFPEIGTFYWLCTANYVHEIWLTMYLVWFIFYCKQSWLQWNGVLLCSIYLGGCAENFSPTLALFLGLVFLYRIIRDRDWRIWKSNQSVLLLVATAIIGIGFLFMLFAPGNDVRMAAEDKSTSLFENFDIVSVLVKTTKASIILLLRFVSRSWYFLCAFPLFVLVGSKSDEEALEFSWEKSIIALVVAIGIIVVSVGATVIGIGWYATMRANSFIAFIFLAWVAYFGMMVGNKIKNRNALISISTYVAALTISITSIVYIAIELPMLRTYHNNVVAIHHQMQQYVKEGRTEMVCIKPVNIPYRQSSYGYLRNALQVLFHKSKRYHEYYFPYEPFRLDSDPADWRNQFYKQWLNANFEVKCIDESVTEDNTK